MKVVSLWTAVLNGLPRYFTGKPCRNGHFSERLVKGHCCLECKRVSSRRHFSNPKAKAKKKISHQKWREANIEKVRKYHRERGREKLPSPSRPNPGFCESCGVKESECRAVLHLDHDHITGLFRGWLCSNCNLAAGNLRDDPEKAIGLAKYLSRAINVKALAANDDVQYALFLDNNTA